MSRYRRNNEQSSTVKVIIASLALATMIGSLFVLSIRSNGQNAHIPTSPNPILAQENYALLPSMTNPFDIGDIGYTLPPETEEETTEEETTSPLPDYDPTFYDAMKQIIADYPSAVLAATENGGDDYLSRIVFLGDSTTYGLKAYGVLPGQKNTKQVWTPRSGTITLSMAKYVTIVYPEDGSEIPIAEAAARAKPEIMVITLGVNGISFMKEADFKYAYGALVDSILQASPNTKIILQSMFPVASHYQKINSINNVKIAMGNRWIAELATEKGLYYLATATALIGQDGFLPAKYQNGDGLHLNYTGYSIELDYIKTHMIPSYVGRPADTTAPETFEETTADTTEDISEETTYETETEGSVTTEPIFDQGNTETLPPPIFEDVE